MSEASMWVVRAGEGGVYADDFEESSVVAIGWGEVGPIAATDADGEVDARFATTYPEWKEGARRNGAAQVRRFIREVGVGHAVATYSPSRRLYLLGTIAGDVAWRAHDLPRTRLVTWKQQVSRDLLSEKLRNTLGSTLTLFRLEPEAAAELFEKAVPYEKRAAPTTAGQGGRTAVPDFQTVLRPLLDLAGDGKEHTVGEAIEHLGQAFQLTPADRQELLPSGKQSRFDNRVGWAVSYLKKGGLITRAGVGRFIISDRGREVLKAPPPRIDVAFLKTRFPDAADFQEAAKDDDGPAVFDLDRGAWQLREPVLQRVRQNIERLVRDEQVRRGVFELLAFAIENADEERSGGWYVLEKGGGLALMTGRQLTCAFTRSKMRVSIIGPLADDVRAAVGADREDDEDFKKIPGSIILTFPLEHAPKALEVLKDAINAFIDATMARLRTEVSLEYHLPEAVAYIGNSLGRELPQPEPEQETAEEGLDDADPEEETDSRLPKIRGRTPMFSRAERSIGSLVSDIHRQEIALPDLQRPFVWEDTKVRDLLDSLFLGFPVGTLVLWHTSNEREARALGADRPGLRATTLIIDGQQRLTSLYAVMRGEEVVDKDGTKRRITIAFRPRDGRFQVSDAAIRRDPEYIPSVTELWDGGRLKSQIRRDLLERLKDSGRAIDGAYEDAVEHNLEVAQAIAEYKFPTVEIRKASGGRGEEATEDDVADIFVRINNQGKRLGQADFVLTLLAVYQPQLRDIIEGRAREMSAAEGAVVGVDTQQLLRVACGVAFGRARMSAVYKFLRGVDATSGDADPASRKVRLDRLEDAAKQCIEKTPWRDFLLRVKHAGFVNSTLIPSKNAIVNAYTFYVRGRAIGVPKQKLDETISRWVFGSLLTARYSTSSETVFEEDLQRVVGLKEGEADAFLRTLDTALGESITGDYWTHTLPSELETQKSRAPSALAFRAAQVVLGARALFSDQLLQNLLDTNVDAGRAASEGHHLFPQAWLQGRGIRDRRLINQVANLADAGWYENNTIGAQNPERYVPRLRESLGISDDAWGRLCAEHALPLGWEKMEYADFLRERRRRMAEIIRVAYGKLGGDSETDAIPPPWFLPGADVVWQRIATTERALRGVVRDVYVVCFGDKAAKRIEDNVPENDRSTLARALRARPPSADPLTVVDYLYLAQLPPLLFSNDVWQKARERFGGKDDVKQRLQTAIVQITPVRNEIAHVREVARERLQRADLACGDVLRMLGQGA